MITAGEGKYQVWLKREEVGNQLVYILGGGEKPHIGSMVLKIPGKECQTVKLEDHYDHVVLEPIAEAASEKYQTKVVALGGVHVDNATKDEIDILIANCRELIRSI